MGAVALSKDLYDRRCFKQDMFDDKEKIMGALFERVNYVHLFCSVAVGAALMSHN
jgi:hypothetical protein